MSVDLLKNKRHRTGCGFLPSDEEGDEVVESRLQVEGGVVR